jgi:dihydrofolate reductase
VITLIAAIGLNNEIGYHGQLLWSIPGDMQHFRSYTTGKVVVMGRKTYESIGRALPNRKNIVLTSALIDIAPCVVVPDMASVYAIEAAHQEIIIIGGANVYAQTIDDADKLVITHVDAEFTADTFFPTIDLSIWKINSSTTGSDDTYMYRIVEYVKHETSRDNNRKKS